jgi:hypothetical protein
VVRATPDEVAAHQARLQAIHAASGACVWPFTEEAEG